MAPILTDRAAERFRSLFGPEFGHGKAFDLARLRRALKALGDPQSKLPPVFHVAGTNGKGSTIAFLRAIAQAAGLRVHAFTKPHVLHLRERFRIAEKLVEDDALIAAAERVAAIDDQLTQFDAQVAAAFLLFTQTRADLVLLETGMGGRDDSTNVILNPALCVLTPIALDHQDALGPMLGDIARHKAGIIKAGAPVIVARQALEVSDLIEARAQRLGAPLYRQGVEWDAFQSAGRLMFHDQGRAVDLPRPSLAGAHQIDNAGLAIACFIAWGDERLSEIAIRQGITQARWPGRLQPLTRGAAVESAGGAEIWVDGGHNPHAGEALARALAEMDRKRPARTVLIIGMRARKDVEAFIAALAPQAALVIAVPLSAEGAPPRRIAAAAKAAHAESEIAADLANALMRARQAGAERVLICGSFVLAGQALALESF